MRTVVSRVVQPIARKQLYRIIALVIALTAVVSTVVVWQLQERTSSIALGSLLHADAYTAELDTLRENGQRAALADRTSLRADTAANQYVANLDGLRRTAHTLLWRVRVRWVPMPGSWRHCVGRANWLLSCDGG